MNIFWTLRFLQKLQRVKNICTLCINNDSFTKLPLCKKLSQKRQKYVCYQKTSVWIMCFSKLLYRYIANQVNLWLYISCLAFSDVHEKFVNIKVKFASIIINFYVMQKYEDPILTKTTFHKNIILFSGQWKSIFKGLVKNCSCVDNNEI